MTKDEFYDKMFDYLYDTIELTLTDGKKVIGRLRNIDHRGDNDDVPGYENIALYHITLPNGDRDSYKEDEVVGVCLVERWANK